MSPNPCAAAYHQSLLPLKAFTSEESWQKLSSKKVARTYLHLITVVEVEVTNGTA